MDLYKNDDYNENYDNISQEEIIDKTIELELEEDEITMYKIDETFEITSFLYDKFKELVFNHNLINDVILDENKINYLDFRKWIDTYFV